MAAGNTYTPLATTTFGTAASSYTFSSISGSYTSLTLIVNNLMSAASGFKLRFNGDTASNYNQLNQAGYGATVTPGYTSTTTSVHNNLVYGDSITANVFSSSIIEINNYKNTAMNKLVLWRYGSNTTNTNSGEVGNIVGQWRSNTAITSIEVSAYNAVNFSIGTTMTLYGIAAA